jgi:methionine-rich copper-binding protein CopC
VRSEARPPISFRDPVRAIAAAGILLAATASAAAAHAEIVSSSPPAGANLLAPPSEVTITFDDELDPDASSFRVTDSHGSEVGGGELDLTVADRNVLYGAVSISNPGVYTVIYTVAGLDGHEIEGTFSFGVLATADIPGPTGGQPDAAMARPGPSPRDLILGGAILLVIAGITFARRITLR